MTYNRNDYHDNETAILTNQAVYSPDSIEEVVRRLQEQGIDVTICRRKPS